MEDDKPTKLDPAALVPLIPATVDVTELILRAPNTIARELRALQKGRDLISVYCSRAEISFLSVLQNVDDTQQSFSFDISVDEALNSAFERTSLAVIAAMPAGIKIQFEIVGGIKRIVDVDGRPSFQAQFPSFIIKLQGRNFLRMPLPTAKPLICTLRHPKGTLIEALLYDLSIGGMGLVIKNGVEVEAGDICTDCRIELNPFGVIEVSVKVLTKRQVVRPDSGAQTIVGTHFINPGRNTENVLHRFIGQLERERHQAQR